MCKKKEQKQSGVNKSALCKVELSSGGVAACGLFSPQFNLLFENPIKLCLCRPDMGRQEPSHKPGSRNHMDLSCFIKELWLKSQFFSVIRIYELQTEVCLSGCLRLLII